MKVANVLILVIVVLVILPAVVNSAGILKNGGGPKIVKRVTWADPEPSFLAKLGENALLIVSLPVLAVLYIFG